MGALFDKALKNYREEEQKKTSYAYKDNSQKNSQNSSPVSDPFNFDIPKKTSQTSQKSTLSNAPKTKLNIDTPSEAFSTETAAKVKENYDARVYTDAVNSAKAFLRDNSLTDEETIKQYNSLTPQRVEELLNDASSELINLTRQSSMLPAGEEGKYMSQINTLRTQIQDYERYIKNFKVTNGDYRYDELKENQDFKNYSKPQNANKHSWSKDDKKHNEVLSGKFVLGANGEIQRRTTLEDIKVSQTGAGLKYYYLTDDEFRKYSYLFNTNNKKEATEYIEYLDPILEARKMQGEIEFSQSVGKESPIVATWGSVLKTAAEPIGSAIAMGKALTGNLEENDPSLHHSLTKNAMRQSVLDNHIDSTIGRLAYNATTGIADVLVTTGIAKGIGGILNKTASALGKTITKEAMDSVISNTTSALMSSATSANAINDALIRGDSYGKAVAIGIARGTIEFLTEKMGIDEIMKNPTTVMKALGKAFVAEGSEEVFSYWSNLILDEIAYGEDSDLRREYIANIQNGDTQGEAFSKGVTNFVFNNIETFVVGGLSGFGLTASGIGVKTAQYEGAIRDYGKSKKDKIIGMAEYAKETFGEDSDAYKKADEILQKTDKGEYVTDKEAGEFAIEFQNQFANDFQENDKGEQNFAEEIEQEFEENSSIELEKDFEDYPYNQQTVLDDYINSVNNDIISSIEEIKNNKDAKFKRISLSTVGEKTASIIKKLTGADVRGYIYSINSNALKHIAKRHGENGIGDNSMSNPEDIARVEYVLNNYDYVDVLKNENGDIIYSSEFLDKNMKPAPLYLFSKKVNGTYYTAVATGENSYKKLWVVTAYISKNKEDITQILHDEISSLGNTSETSFASLSSVDNSLSQEEPIVNTNDMQNDGNYTSNTVQSSDSGVDSAEYKGLIRSLGKNGQKAYADSVKSLIKNNPNASELEILRNFNRYYIGALVGKSRAEINSDYADRVPDEVKKLAYNAGVADRKSEINNQRKMANSEVIKNGGLIENDYSDKLSDKQKEYISGLAKKLGVAVEIVDSVKTESGAEANGEYVNGVIRLSQKTINENPSEAVKFILAHEVSHRIKALAPKEFQKFSDLAVRYAAKKTGKSAVDIISDKVTERSKKGNNVDIPGATEEIAADVAGQFFDEGFLTYAAKENYTLMDKIRGHLFDLLDTLGIRKYTDVEALKRTWDKALQTAQNQVKKQSNYAENLKAEGSKASERQVKYSEGEIQRIINKDFKTQVSETLHTNISDGNQVRITDSTPSILRQCGLNDLPMQITRGHLRDIHHEKVPNNTKYHGISEGLINRIPEFLSNPVMVFDSISTKNPNAVCILAGEVDGDELPIIVVIKPDGKGRYNDVTVESNVVLSVYGKNSLQTYLNELDKKIDNVIMINKKRTKELLNAARLQLPAGLNNLKSNYILHQSKNVVKPQNKNSVGEINPFLNENSGVNNYTDDEQRNISKEGKSYRNLVIDKDITLKEFFGRSRKNSGKFEKLYIGKISEDLASRVNAVFKENDLEIDVNGEHFILTNDMFDHTIKEHGANSKESAEKVTDKNIEYLLDVINAPDAIEFGGFTQEGNPKIIFKKIINGTNGVYVQFNSLNRNGLIGKTFYFEGKMKNKGDALANDDINASVLYVQNDQSQSPFNNNSISHNDTDVNNNDMQKSGEYSVGPINPFEQAQADLEYLNSTYGVIEPGENAVRDVRIPKKNEDGTYNSRFSRTAAESAAFTDEQAAGILEAVKDGTFSYTRMTDKKARELAEVRLKKAGYKESLEQWNAALKGERALSKNEIAFGEYLLEVAAKKGETSTVVKLVAEIAAEGTRAGQVVQAMRLLKKMNGAGQLVYINRVVDGLQKDMDKRFGKKAPQIKVSENLKEKLVQSKSPESVREITDEILEEVAEQMPSTWFDKWNAWRYLAMLGNPRTHIRNIVGNAVFAPAVAVKNVIGAGLESAVDTVSKATRGKGIERTKTLAINSEYLSFANDDYAQVKDILSGGGKMNIQSKIDEKRRIFKSAPLEAMRNLNSNLLEAEDGIFLKGHYVAALSSYLAANKIDINSLTIDNKDGYKALEKARNYAINEAKKATYRDMSKIANWLTSMSKASKAGGIIIDAGMPFKKTPINILKRGIEYSPIYLVDTLARGSVKLASNDMSVSEFIDRLSTGLTGTGIMILGTVLANMGFLRGSSKDDEEEFAELRGEQAYSLQFGEHSYTIDWAAPVALPLFVGVELNRLLERDNMSIDVVLDSSSTLIEPIFEMSMLSGLNNILEAPSKNYDDKAVIAITKELIAGYLGQAVPTAMGQVTRTFFDDTARRTYTDKNNSMPDWIEYPYQKQANKVPLLSKNQEPYVDEWGREQKTESMAERFFENFISPGYYDKAETSRMENELIRLSKITDENVFPTTVSKKFTVNGTEKHLTAKEYTKYQKSVGQKSYKFLTNLTQNERYADLTDEEKIQSVLKTYELAEQISKKDIAPEYKRSEWVNEALNAPDSLGMTTDEFIMTYIQYGDTIYSAGAKAIHEKGYEISNFLEFKENIKDLKGEPDPNKPGEYIAGSKQKKIIAEISKMDISEQEKAFLFSTQYESTKNNPWKDYLE